MCVLAKHPDIQELLKGSDFEGPYDCWKRAREGINRHIAACDTVLDVGCANGMLLASLLEWHGTGFIPYGIDIDEVRISRAKSLLPSFADNFYVRDFFSNDWLPRKVDIVIAPWYAHTSFINTCLRHANSKVVFTVYDDRLARGVNAQVASRRAGLPVAASEEIPGIMQIVVVSGIAHFSGKERSWGPRPNIVPILLKLTSSDWRIRRNNFCRLLSLGLDKEFDSDRIEYFHALDKLLKKCSIEEDNIMLTLIQLLKLENEQARELLNERGAETSINLKEYEEYYGSLVAVVSDLKTSRSKQALASAMHREISDLIAKIC